MLAQPGEARRLPRLVQLVGGYWSAQVRHQLAPPGLVGVPPLLFLGFGYRPKVVVMSLFSFHGFVFLPPPPGG